LLEALIACRTSAETIQGTLVDLLTAMGRLSEGPESASQQLKELESLSLEMDSLVPVIEAAIQAETENKELEAEAERTRAAIRKEHNRTYQDLKNQSSKFGESPTVDAILSFINTSIIAASDVYRLANSQEIPATNIAFYFPRYQRLINNAYKEHLHLLNTTRASDAHAKWEALYSQARLLTYW
jgi:hypothetical protein